MKEVKDNFCSESSSRSTLSVKIALIVDASKVVDKKHRFILKLYKRKEKEFLRKNKKHFAYQLASYLAFRSANMGMT